MKRMLILGDSIVKYVDGWRLNKRMKSSVSVRSVSGASSRGMEYHVKGCIVDDTPDSIILHFGTNSLKEKNETAETIADNIVNVAESVKEDVSEIFVSSLTKRHDELDRKRVEVNEHLKKK